jgi:hypothetical protein
VIAAGGRTSGDAAGTRRRRWHRRLVDATLAMTRPNMPQWSRRADKR